jgi:FkbH-like protein
MNLQEALRVIRDSGSRPGDALKVCLVCSFTPVHLATFLSAHLIGANAGRRVQCITTGYGSLVDGLRGADAHAVQAVAVVIQWTDLDPRLGLRRTGGWQRSVLDDICQGATQRLTDIYEHVRRLSSQTKTVISLPCLPLPPAFPTPAWSLSPFEAQLRHAVTEFAVACSKLRMVAVLNEQWLEALVAGSERHDAKGEIAVDSPLRVACTSALGKGLATLITPPAALKGIITDLDDTVWRGIIGDVGVETVSWNLDGASQNHALYQQLLEALASNGVLLAVASKNDPDTAAAGLARADLLVPGSRFYPVEASWSAKSDMVGRILTTWNVGEDAVLFVDDNPMEIAQIQSRFPSMKCLLFPTRDLDQSVRLLSEIRDLFGTQEITEEDLLRSESIRRGEGSVPHNSSETDIEDFLAQMDATLDIHFGADPSDARPLQLINKTNQFNINGIRLSDSAWMKLIADPKAVILVASYTDKFGPLGKIAVAVGEFEGSTFSVQHWVLSCRAFARRIEYRMLEVLFRTLDVRSIEFRYNQTEKNQAFGHFLQGLMGSTVSGPVVMTRHAFDAVCPNLYERCTVDGYRHNESTEKMLSLSVSRTES